MAVITNTATMSGYVNGEEVSAGSNTTMWNLNEPANVTFTKAPETGEITPGVPFDVTLTLTNNDANTLYNITIRDVIDPSLTVVPNSVYVNGQQLDSSQWSFVDGVLIIDPNVTLGAGESAEITFQVITD